MKNIFKWVVLTIIVAITATACAPQEDASISLGNVVPASDIQVSITPDAKNPNLLTFKLLTPQCVGIFKCPDAGIGVTSMEFTQLVPLPGTYNLSVQVYNKAGISDVASFPFSLTTTDVSIYNWLTGGLDNVNGKTWRIDGNVAGHIGCGEESASSNSWWAPGPNSLSEELYDDDMTFAMNGYRFKLDNKGASFMNESTAALFPDGDPDGSFITTNYSPASDATWNIINEGGAEWLVINKGFPAYAVNPDAVQGGKYKIISKSNTDMHIAYIPGGISWHYYLTSKAR